MPINQDDDALDKAALSATEREWLERQARAARALEIRQRKAASKRGRSTVKRRDRDRDRPRDASLPRQRS